MAVEAATPVGHIAAEYPLATRVFARHGIDFCCGGGKPIGEVCETKGLKTKTILDEIAAEVSGPGEDEIDWNNAPLDSLIDHIISTFHRPLQEELPRLEYMARKVARVHLEKAPQILPNLLATVLALKTELESHMMKEEEVLFPMIRTGNGCAAGGSVSVLEHEHEVAGEALAKLRELTDNFTVPAGACNTWIALWHGLEALEGAMHIHIHLENNILFPRALAS